MKKIIFRPRSWQLGFVMDCNLRCSYCSTRYGTYGLKPGTMSENVCEALVALAFAHAPENRRISFEYGVGETFLEFDRFLSLLETIKRESMVHGVKPSVTVCTNGTLLDTKKLDLLAKNNVCLTFSIDGPQKIHDRCRKDQNGRGSFHRSIKNWAYFKELSKKPGSKFDCSVQSVLSQNFSLQELNRFWAEEGETLFSCLIQMPGFKRGDKIETEWEQRKARYLSQWRNYAVMTSKTMTVPGFLSQYKGPEDLYQMWGRHFLNQELAPCGAGNTVAAADINGNIYPCEFFIGHEKWIIGTVFDGFYPEKISQFRQLRRQALSICDDCDIRTLCPKSCLGVYPENELIDNFKMGCKFARELVTIAIDSYPSERPQAS